MSEVFTGQFYINVAASFDGTIQSLADLANVPRASDGVVLATVPNSKGIDVEYTEAQALADGWTQQQWNYAEGTVGTRALWTHWCGAAYSDSSRLYMVHGGGDAASGFNSTYGFDLNTMSWRCLNAPSRNALAKASPYPDGTPPSTHSYNLLVVDQINNNLVLPFHAVYTIDSAPPQPGGRGLWAYLPLDSLTADPVANLDLWTSYFPSGDPETPGFDAYENGHGFWDPSTGEILTGGPGVNYRRNQNYLAGGLWESTKGVYKLVKAPSAGALNPNNQEIWIFGSLKEGTSYIEDSMYVQDISGYAAGEKITSSTVTLTGTRPRVNQLYGFVAGSTPTSTAELVDPNLSFQFDTKNNQAVYWRPLATNEPYWQDGVEITLAEKEASVHRWWVFDSTYHVTEYGLSSQSPSGLGLPTFHRGQNIQNAVNNNKGGPMNKMQYIAEFDIFMYSHSADSDVMFLKFPIA